MARAVTDLTSPLMVVEHSGTDMTGPVMLITKQFMLQVSKQYIVNEQILG